MSCLKKVIYLSDLTKCGVNFDFHTKLGKKYSLRKRKLARLEKWLAFPVFSLNFSSAGKGPFMAGKAKNALEAHFLRGNGGVGGG